MIREQEQQRLQRILRNTGLLRTAEKVRDVLYTLKHYRRARRFSAENPDFQVPPRALALDAYSAPDWDYYKKSGSDTAYFLNSIAAEYLAGLPALRVLEWGCGPARVIRHLPSAFGSRATIYGSDYNTDTIEWCHNNIPGINFSVNGLHPPLQFDDSFFDLIYSISVFTHLSESVGHEWANELYRIMRPGAIAIISTHGDQFLDKLLPDEREVYKSRGIVVRGGIQEGKRLFFAIHSTAYLRENLFKKFDVLEFGPGRFPHTSQDIWILRKP